MGTQGGVEALYGAGSAVVFFQKRPDGLTPLILAAERGHLAMVDLLLASSTGEQKSLVLSEPRRALRHVDAVETHAHKLRTGRGQRVDTSLYEAAIVQTYWQSAIAPRPLPAPGN